MGLLLKQLFSFIKLLNSENGNVQIAAGIACGFVLGMSPFFSLQSFVIFFVLFVFRIQIGAAFTAAFFFKFLAYILDPAFDRIGRWALESESLQDLWTTLYNMPVIPFTRFNNSIVMGSGILAIVLTPFVFILSQILITKYRTQILARLQDSKFWKVVKATSLYQWYEKYDSVRSAYNR